MPITRSAKKALRQNEKKRVVNLRKRREIKALFRQIQALVKQEKREEAKALLPQYYKKIDKAAKKGYFKENKAARKKSRAARITNKELKQP